MSEKDKTEISQITCNVIEATRNMDAAQRVKEVNAAREQMGEERFLGTDDEIQISVEMGLCVNLVRNDKQWLLETGLIKELAHWRAEARRLEKESIAREKRKKEAEKEAEIAKDKRRDEGIKKCGELDASISQKCVRDLLTRMYGCVAVTGDLDCKYR